jgi:hypothetical protein
MDGSHFFKHTKISLEILLTKSSEFQQLELKSNLSFLPEGSERLLTEKWMFFNKYAKQYSTLYKLASGDHFICL